MARFVARQWGEHDGIKHMIGLWGIFDTKNENECLFGNKMPRDKEEAEQCARAAELAFSICQEEWIKKVRNFYY